MLLTAVLIGILATAFLDAYGWLLQRGLKVPAPNYCVVGRWVAGIPGGAFALTGEAKSRPVRSECALGWATHYALGIGFAAVFLLVVGPGWVERPILWPVLLFGAVSVAAPFLVLHPALGMGVASSKAPRPNVARARSLVAHLVFGLGLYLSALSLSAIR